MCDIYEYVGSEQNFKNLVDKILDQLKKKNAWFLKSLNALVLSIIIIEFISY